MTAVFGPAFSRALVEGCALLGVPPEWTLAKIALESGFNPNASNGSGARGLWQKMPEQVWGNGKPLTVPVGSSPPPGCILRAVKGVSGKILHMTVWRLYSCPAPEVQIRDAFRSWRSSQVNTQIGPFKTREALYCLNLAPARLAGGEYDDETIIYSADPADAPLNRLGGRFTLTFWPTAYRENAAPFGLNPSDSKGKIRMHQLAYGLDKYVAINRARYDAELAAAYVANVR